MAKSEQKIAYLLNCYENGISYNSAIRNYNLIKEMRGTGKTIRGILELAKQISLNPHSVVVIAAHNTRAIRYIHTQLDEVLHILTNSKLYDKMMYVSYDNEENKVFDADECEVFVQYSKSYDQNIIIFADHYKLVNISDLIKNKDFFKGWLNEK